MAPKAPTEADAPDQPDADQSDAPDQPDADQSDAPEESEEAEPEFTVDALITQSEASGKRLAEQREYEEKLGEIIGKPAGTARTFVIKDGKTERGIKMGISWAIKRLKVNPDTIKIGVGNRKLADGKPGERLVYIAVAPDKKK